MTAPKRSSQGPHGRRGFGEGAVQTLLGAAQQSLEGAPGILRFSGSGILQPLHPQLRKRPADTDTLLNLLLTGQIRNTEGMHSDMDRKPPLGRDSVERKGACQH